MSESFWTDPEFSAGGEFVKFENIGDTITGRITLIKAHRFEDGKVVPQISLDCNGEERTLTAGQIRLKAELVAQRPDVGDTLTVTLSDIEKRAGGKTLKHFAVDITRGGKAAPKPAAAPAAKAPPAAPATADQLTDEQRAALAGLGL
jgi:hypothetical protein